MTVQELINQLAKLPPDADVWTVRVHYGTGSFQDSEAVLHISTEGYVFIVPDDDYITWWIDQS